jgi:hypothetical protein
MTGNPPRLTLRIAGYTAVALLFAAGAILWFVHQRATSQAESQAATRAQLVELQRMLPAPRRLA